MKFPVLPPDYSLVMKCASDRHAGYLSMTQNTASFVCVILFSRTYLFRFCSACAVRRCGLDTSHARAPPFAPSQRSHSPTRTLTHSPTQPISWEKVVKKSSPAPSADPRSTNRTREKILVVLLVVLAVQVVLVVVLVVLVALVVVFVTTLIFVLVALVALAVVLAVMVALVVALVALAVVLVVLS